MRPLILILFVASLFAAEEGEAIMRVRPDTWAKEVIGSEVENFYKLDDKVYRSEQPDDDGMQEIEKFGIKSVFNLRDHHSDDDEAEDTKLKLFRVEMNAGSITQEQLIEALVLIQDAPKPIVVHCWHGSDRTGAVCAAYRIVFQGWSKKDAIDELYNGGYGFHSTFYKNIPKLLNKIDATKMKTAVLAKSKTQKPKAKAEEKPKVEAKAKE